MKCDGGSIECVGIAKDFAQANDAAYGGVLLSALRERASFRRLLQSVCELVAKSVQIDGYGPRAILRREVVVHGCVPGKAPRTGAVRGVNGSKAVVDKGSRIEPTGLVSMHQSFGIEEPSEDSGAAPGVEAVRMTVEKDRVKERLYFVRDSL